MLDLHVGDRLVRLIEVGPAHTAGDVVVHLHAEPGIITENGMARTTGSRGTKDLLP